MSGDAACITRRCGLSLISRVQAGSYVRLVRDVTTFGDANFPTILES